MSDLSSKEAVKNDSLKVRQDDFRMHADVIDDERRLHLRAFDYWHRLKAEKNYPLFTDLRPDELAPYKTNSMLLEFKEKGTVVRFIGEAVIPLIEAPITVGSYLQDFKESIFARALVDQFRAESGRDRAAEFEFVEEHIECRGMLLPFSADGTHPHFVLVVANFHKISPTEKHAPTDTMPDAALEAQLIETQAFASGVGHPDSSTRSALYEALAKALALYEASAADTETYDALLENAGLRVQARAPYTPILKLVFGTNYDKTRLTEYASALACAVRDGVTSATLVEYLHSVPGGIKGCVQKERAFKRGQTGTSANSRQQEAEKVVRNLPVQTLSSLTINKEFSLLLVRKGKNGVPDVIGEVEVSDATLASLIRKAADNRGP